MLFRSSVNACSCHLNMDVILGTHPLRGKSHIPRNANEDFATLLSTNVAVTTVVQEAGVLGCNCTPKDVDLLKSGQNP